MVIYIKKISKSVIYYNLFRRYRAEVLNIIESNPNERQAELYYVDYGDTDVLPCTDLFELRTDFLRLHFQAIECFLARVGVV